MMRTYAASLAIVALIIVPAATLKAFSLRVFSSGGGGSWKDGTYAVTVGSTVRFTCTPSGGASPYAYVWDFDDIETYKKPTTGQNPSHTFGLPGIHDVRVYVADNESNEESAYLRIHVKDRLTEYDAVTDGGLVDDDLTDNTRRLQDLIDSDSDGKYRIQFRRTRTGVYRFKSTIAAMRGDDEISVLADLGSATKVEFVGEPGVVIKFTPSSGVDSFFNLNNENRDKYALFSDLGFLHQGPPEDDGSVYMLSQMMQKGNQYQIWRNCDFQNVRKVSRNNRDIVIRCNFDRWGRHTGNLNYGFENSLWKYNYIHNPWPDHSHPFYNREYWHLYYIGNYIDVLPQADDSKVGLHWRDGRSGGSGDRRHNWAIGNLIRNVPGWAIKLNTESQSVNTSNIKINDNIIIGTYRNESILVERSDGNVEVNNNFFTECRAPLIRFGASDKPMLDATASYNFAGYHAGKDASGGGRSFVDCSSQNCDIRKVGNIDDASRHRPGDPSGWYDESGYLDPGEFEFYAPSGSVVVTGAGRNVILRLSAVDMGSGLGLDARFPFKEGGLMQFSNDGMTWSEIRPYSRTANWTLTENGTVYARFRDRNGNWSKSISGDEGLSEAISPPKNVRIVNE